MKPPPAARLETSPWRRALALLLAGLMALPPAAVFAGPPVAAGSTNTTVLPNGSGNGVPVVNIAAPNGAGLSHNKFNSYDVPAQGLILNNSAGAVQTQLGGFVQGNANVAAARANIILNEVVQPNRSLLNGYTEVAGQAAQVIVANPYGITCAGCGFINTPRATLTTGTPNIDANGNLTGFAVRQGDILINGAGLDASSQNYFDLVARSVVIQGQVNAKDLLVAAGRNDMDYSARTVTPVAGVDAAPAYAIDSSALGGMYVDRIRLIATEAGVGVRMLGNVGASVDDITLSAAGRIQLQNQMSAQRDISVAYNGAATAGAIDVGAGAQLYAGRNQSIAGGAGGIQLGTALVGAGGDLSITGASLADTGAAADYRFANGALSVNVEGHAALGGASYDAVGALRVTGATVDLGAAGLLGRSAASGLSVTSTFGALDVNGAQLSSPGSIALNSADALTLGAAAFVGSNANVTASFANSLTSAGTVVADGNLQLLNSSASGNIVSSGYLSTPGTMTLGAGSANTFQNAAGGTLLAGTLNLNAQSVLNEGYLQAKSANLTAGAMLFNSGAGATMVLGTAAADSNTLTLNRLENTGTLYSAGNLTLSTIQLDNLAGGKLIADGTLSASANRAVGATGLSNTLTNAGSIDANNATLTAPSIVLTGGTLYAANDASLTATGSLTMGGSLYAAHDLGLSAGTLADAVLGGATRAAGHDLTLSSANAISLDNGQVYDAGNLLSVNTPQLLLATTGSTLTRLTSGGDISVVTDDLKLGGAGAKGSLQAANDITIAPRSGASSLNIQVGASGGPGGSIEAGGDINATFDQLVVRGQVLANQDINLRTQAIGAQREVVTAGSGWLEAGGTLSFRGATGGTRASSIYVNPGTTIAGGAFDIYTSSTYVGGLSGSVGRLQGGTGGGVIDTTTLSIDPYGQLIANQYNSAATHAHTSVNIGGNYTNTGLLYAGQDMTVTVMGNITNNAGAAISSGAGQLNLRTDLSDYSLSRTISNYGLIYGGLGLDLRVTEGGTIFNAPGGEIGSGLHAYIGQNTNSGDFTGTVRNEGAINVVGDATIRAHYFYNEPAIGSVVLNPAQSNQSRVYLDDSGRYDDFLSVPGYDHAHPPVVAAGAGDHNGRPNYQGSGVNYYIVVDRGHTLLRDFRNQWTQDEQYTGNAAAPTPTISAGGTLTIYTETGLNRGASIYGGTLVLEGLYGANSGTFTNESVSLMRRYYNSYGRSFYSCFGSTGNDIACTGVNSAVYQGDEYLNWTAGGARPANWTFDDGTPQEVFSEVIPGSAKPATLKAVNFISRMGNTVNLDVNAAQGVTPSTSTGTPAGSSAPNAGRGATGPVQVTSPTSLNINGVNVNLPAGPNGLFVLSQNPNSRFLVESNPLYVSADNPFLGSDYLAKLLGFDPDKLALRLGDANYEAKLIRDQIVAQTGASLLRTAWDAHDQEKQLLDNASLEAKELKLNYGAALTAEQVAGLKHDIVWMVEQVVQGKKVLVPTVYLSSATRASVGGASIVADTAVITGDSFLNRGGTVTGASNLVIVTRKDIVNSSGEISGGKVQLQSLEGDIINRTETFKVGDGNNYTTTAGRAGGIYASGDLFMKAGQDVNVEGATVAAGGDATVLAGRNVNVSALVLEARKTNITNTSGMFNRDVSQTQETTQTALGAAIVAGGNLGIGAKNDIDLKGAYVGTQTGTTTLMTEQGNVNIGTVQLTNTKQENTEHVGFFADSRAGSKPKPEDASVQSGQASAPPGTQPPTVGGVAGRMGTADSNKTGGDKPEYDPNAHSAEAFTGLAITTTRSSSTATGNLGSTVQGGGVNIVAQKGDVNVQGSSVTSGAQGTLIDAAGNVNITAAYDTVSSTRNEQSTRIGVAAEAGPGGAFAGVKVDGSSLDSQRSSSTAVTSALGSQGSISIRAGGNLLNEGTTINAAKDVNVMATTVENRAAQNTTNVNESSSQFNVSVMGGLTTGGIGDSISGMVQGTSKELNVGAPEAQLRAQASGSSTTTVGNTSTAVVTDIKSGGNTNFQVTGRMLDQGTSYSATGSVNIDAGSYENRAAANTSTMNTSTTSGGGTLTVGVDASRSANANLAIQGSNSASQTSSSTAVTGSITGAGGVNIRSRTGDVTLEGAKVDGGKPGVSIDAAGNLNLLQANNTSTTNSKTTEGSANLSASLCVDLSCASAGAGASARTTTLNENVTQGVAGSLSGGNISLRSGGNTTLQGTNIQSAGNVSLDAGGKVDFQALTSTISSTSTADGGGANLNANVGASGKLATDGGGGGSLSFERGRGTTEGTVREGGSINAGTLSIRSGGDTRLEGTQVQAGSAALNVGGNLTLESAQSTLKSDQSGVSGSIQASGGKSEDGGRNFGGAISLDVTNKTQDILTNQNATINTTGTTTLNVGGNATLAGANINAQGGVAGDIKGNLTVETRADHEKTEDTSFKGYAGVGNMQIAGKGDGSKPSTANRIDAIQDKVGNVANAAGGTGVFIDYKSDKTDNVTIGQRSGISGGAGGLGGLTVGGNATLTGAQGTQGINVQGTTTTSGGPQTRQSTTSDSFTLRGTVASAAGSDQGSGGTFSNLFQASGAQKPGTPVDAPDVVTRPRSSAVSGDEHRPTGGPARPASESPVTLTRPADNEPSGAFQPVAKPPAGVSSTFTTTSRPRSDAVSGEGARPKIVATPAGSSAPGTIPPGRPRSESVGPDTRPANDGPTQYGAFQPLPGPVPSKPIASTPQAPSAPGVIPPGRPRSESTGTDTRPADGPVQYGAFTPLPGSTTPGPVAASGPSSVPPGRPRSDSVADTPSKPAANSPGYGAFAPVPGSTPPAPVASAPGRPRSESIADTPSKPAANSPEYGAFTPLPGSTPPGPIAASGPSNTPPGRPRSDSIADTPSKPAANSPEYGAFTPIPGSTPPAPIASAPGRPRSDSVTDTPSKPAANSPEYGAFAPIPGSAPPAPIASAPGRPRSESIADTPSKPTANSPEYGAFAPLPGSTPPAPVAASGPSNMPPGRPRSDSVADTASKPAANSPEYGAFAPVPGSTPSKPAAKPEGAQVAAIKPAPAAAPAAGPAPIQTRAELMRTLGAGKERPKNPNESGPGIDRRTFVSPETNLKLTTSASKYNGEETRGVKYYTPTERAAHELTVDKATGKLLDASGKPYNTPSDRPDGAIFVIDAHGKIYASGDAEYQKFHHTSLTGNEPVALAGHLVVKDGKLLHINNVSGHYRPDGEQLTGGVNYMKDTLKVDFGNTRVIEMTPRGRLIDLKDGKTLTGISVVSDAIKQDVDRANGVGAPPGSSSGYGAGAAVPRGPAQAPKKAVAPKPGDATQESGKPPASNYGAMGGVPSGERPQGAAVPKVKEKSPAGSPVSKQATSKAKEPEVKGPATSGYGAMAPVPTEPASKGKDVKKPVEAPASPVSKIKAKEAAKAPAANDGYGAFGGASPAAKSAAGR